MPLQTGFNIDSHQKPERRCDARCPKPPGGHPKNQRLATFRPRMSRTRSRSARSDPILLLIRTKASSNDVQVAAQVWRANGSSDAGLRRAVVGSLSVPAMGNHTMAEDQGRLDAQTVARPA